MQKTISEVQIMEYEVRAPDWGDDRFSLYLVDRAFLKCFVAVGEKNKLTLIDRQRKYKRLNDRLLIGKIDQELKRVCPLCLVATFPTSKMAFNWLRSRTAA